MPHGWILVHNRHTVVLANNIGISHADIFSAITGVDKTFRLQDLIDVQQFQMLQDRLNEIY
jgi:hypothetical protein